MQQCVFISIFVESHNLNLMHMKQKLVRIGISGIQKQKERFCLIFPVLLFIFIFPASSIAQTIAEEYNFNFKGGEEQKWSWIKNQTGCFTYIESMQIKKDDNIVYKISYTPPPSKNKNMIFIASCTIMIPEQINGDSCQVSIKSKTREITNAWLTVTALNSNEVAVASEDKKLEHPEWTDNVLSLKLTDGKYKAKALRINIFYFGNSNPDQQICLSDLQINIDGKDLGKQSIEDQTVINTNIHKRLIKNKIIKLSHDNDSTLLTRINELKDKKIIGLGECTHGSQELKTAVIQFSKNLIQNGDCRFVLLEAPVDALLLVDAYIQGIISSPDIEKQIKEIMQMFFTNNSELMGFVDWLKEYNKTSLRKVHLSGMDYKDIISPYFYDYLLNLLDKEKGRYYLLKLYDKEFKDILQYAHEDVYLKTKLGEENFSLFTQYIETCINLGIGSQLPPPDYRDFYMFTYTKQLADHFLKKDEKLIIHAHSAHLSNLERFDSFPYKEIPAGNRLKKYYGDKYYSIGFQVGEGTFAQESAGYFSKLIALPLSKPPYNSFEHLALSTKESYFYYPSKYMDDGIVELLVIPRMARYQRQYQFHSVKNWCDAYVFIQESTPLKNVTTGEFETMFKQFLRIKELIKELKANEEQYN